MRLPKPSGRAPRPLHVFAPRTAAMLASPGAAAALKKAGAVAVYLAGPSSILKTLLQDDTAAIDRLVFEGCNALAILQEAQAALKVRGAFAGG